MGFGTALRHVADASRPLNRRVTSLSNAIEKFPVLGFHGTFYQLHVITGSSSGVWTSEQLALAAHLLAEAHESWNAAFLEAMRETRRAKRLRPYVPRVRGQQFDIWRESYFDDQRRREWKLDPHIGVPSISDFTLALRKSHAWD